MDHPDPDLEPSSMPAGDLPDLLAQLTKERDYCHLSASASSRKDATDRILARAALLDSAIAALDSLDSSLASQRSRNVTLSQELAEALALRDELARERDKALGERDALQMVACVGWAHMEAAQLFGEMVDPAAYAAMLMAKGPPNPGIVAEVRKAAGLAVGDRGATNQGEQPLGAGEEHF